MQRCLQLLAVVGYLITAHSSITQADERPVQLDGQPNFRDIGGYKTADGKSVKRGLVFRSGELPRMTDEDITKLERLGIKTVVNFLTEIETDYREKDRLPDGVRVVSQPIETDDGLAAAVVKARKTADFSALPPTINPGIYRILVDDARSQYAVLLRQIARTNEPLVFHCSHGVHRTGTATAILLWTLGVPWEVVREDYLLSNKFRKSEIEKRRMQLRQLAAKNQDVPLEEVDMSNINAFYVLQGSYIDATRDEILNKYDSIEAYLTKGLGLTKLEIHQLRSRLLD
jgi:protein-tyrosine phosphatase